MLTILRKSATVLTFILGFVSSEGFTQCTSAPTSFSSTAVSTTSASLTWNSSGATAWQVEYGPFGFSQGSGTTINTTSSTINISSLGVNVRYQAYVRKNCGSGSYSPWTSATLMVPTLTICTDGFESYTVGDVDAQSIFFDGWAGSGGNGDISTAQASSGTKSLKVHNSGSSGYTDIVALPGTYTSGVKSVKFDIFIPTNYGGYYNVLHNYVGASGNVWAIEVYFSSNGTFEVQEGSNGSGTIGTEDYNVNAWNTIEHIINLDDDTAFIKVNGNYTDLGWQFSLGSSNYGGQFNAIDLYSAAPSGQTPLEYFDNICYSDAPIDDVGLTILYNANPNCGDSTYPITVVLKNFAENAQSGFDINATITGSYSASINFTYPGVINPGQTDTVVIGYLNALGGGTIAVEAYTDLSGDTDNSNDTIAANNVIILPGVALDLGLDQSYCSNESFQQTLSAVNSSATYQWSTGSTGSTISIDTAGVYWCTVSNGYGCSKSDTLHVIEFVSPNINLGGGDSYCSNETYGHFLDAGSGFSTYAWSTGGTTQFFFADSAGSYVVTVTNSFGCVDADTFVVVENQIPVIPIQDTAVCAGDTLVLDAGNIGSTYQWSVSGQSGQTIVVTTENTYSVTVTDANGCSNSESIYATFNILPLVLLGNDTFLLQGQSVTLNAGNPGASYAWSNGATTQTITVNKAGIYSVTVTNEFGCSEVDAIKVFINIGIKENTISNLTLYPNPTTSKAFIKGIMTNGGELEVAIYEISGKLVFTEITDVSKGNVNIPLDFATLPEGLYFVKLSQENIELKTFRVTCIR